jgi:hypothetical protein
LIITEAITDGVPTQWKRFNWWTEYSEKNFTETDALWDAINPAHGFIAMDRDWAKERQWPNSMHLPSDDSKNVYLLEAYHLLHCVVRGLSSFLVSHMVNYMGPTDHNSEDFLGSNSSRGTLHFQAPARRALY